MKPDQFDRLARRFHRYADAYIERAAQPGPLRLKKEHTLRVSQEITALGMALGLDEKAVQLAKTMALFHDLGRFRQFEKYKTFLDTQSENHARRSLLEIRKVGMLHGCTTARESALIRGAIAVHNAAELPGLKDKEMLFFMKLLRDADKLDIWRVVIDNYTRPDPDNEASVNLGLQDRRGFTPEAVEALTRRTYVKSRAIHELNDFKLMQISWVFDLNFSHTVAIVRQRHYIETIEQLLSIPQDDSDYLGVHKAVAGVYEYMDDVVR